MNERPVSDFAYVGGRPYIRGVDLAGFCLDHFDAVSGEAGFPVQIKSLKLMRELRRNGIWVSADDSAIDGEGPEPSAVMDLVDAEGKTRKLMFLETGDTITRTAADVSSLTTELVSDGAFAGRANLVAPVDFMVLLGGLVEANKALHSATLTERGIDPASIRFVYVERLPVLSQAIDSSVAMRITHRGERVLDGRSYTLNIAEIDFPDGPVKAMICFSYDPE